MGKIATWSEVNSKIFSSGGPADKCPTKAEIEATGKGKVDAKAGINQLVSTQQIQISADWYLNVAFKEVITGSNGDWEIGIQYKILGGNLENYPNQNEFDLMLSVSIEMADGKINNYSDIVQTTNAEGFMNMIGEDWQDGYNTQYDSNYERTPIVNIYDAFADLDDPSITINY